MPLLKLPPIIIAFIEATNGRDADALNALFSTDAVLACGGETFSGPKLAAWNRDRYLGSGVKIHPINVMRKGRETVLTVMAFGEQSLVETAMPTQIDMSFETRGNAVSSLNLAATKQIPVPAPVSGFVNAMNTFDLSAMNDLFLTDALVNDQLREFWGKPAIIDWASEDIIGQRMTMHVTEVIEHREHVFVRANVDGDFDKRGLPDPLNLTFSFFLVEGRIGQLLILNNRTAD